MSMASAARAWPCSAASCSVRMSLESPESPRSPDRLLSASITCVGGQPSAFVMCPMIEGSIDPERVPITTPSSGVRPIVVSTLWPFRTAASEQPFPRCAVTMAWSPGRARAASRPAARRSGGSCRGSRSGAPRASRTSRTAPGRGRRAAASSGGRRCRRPRPAAASGRAPAAIAMPSRFGGLWSGPRGMHSSILWITSGVTGIDPENFAPPWTTRWPTPAISRRARSARAARRPRGARRRARAPVQRPWTLRAGALPVERRVRRAEPLRDAGDALPPVAGR